MKLEAELTKYQDSSSFIKNNKFVNLLSLFLPIKLEHRNIVDTVRIEQRLNTVLIVLICISFSANHSSRKL